MGTCCSSGPSASEARLRKWEKERERQIEIATRHAKTHDDAIKKLLLLGAGESGKSTLFKQMIQVYGKGYSPEELNQFADVIYNNVLVSMKTLIEASRDLSDYWLDDNPDAAEDEDPYWIDVADDVLDLIEDTPMDTEIDEELGDAIRELWADEGVRNTWDERAYFQVMDSAAYFFNKIDDICKPDFQPTFQDALCARVRTTGIVETAFEIERNTFKMYDVGGQRNERRKWIHCFENVTCVMFVAAISEYDQKLYEAEDVNRMVETLDLFNEIMNSRWFAKTSTILFLNKRDLFAEKIKEVPLTVCEAFDDFPDNADPNSYEDGCDYLIRKFRSLNRTTNEIYPHVTCATDSDQIYHVFNAVKDVIIRLALNQTGLMEM